jgi:hypothetical protein
MSRVQRHRRAIFRPATLGEHRIAGTREFLNRRPYPLRNPSHEGSTRILKPIILIDFTGNVGGPQAFWSSDLVWLQAVHI